MHKSFVVTAAALAIVAMGSLAAGTAQAGSSTSAASKYNNEGAGVTQVPTGHGAQAAVYPITEFSSSSAKSTAPKR